MVAQVLAHPLTVLTLGAVLTGFLAPLVLRKIQDRKARLDLNVSLIEDVVTVMETYFADLHRLELKGAKAQVALDDAMTSVRESGFVLEARLAASVPSAVFAIHEWREMTNGFWAIYFVLKNKTPELRRHVFEENEEWLGSIPQHDAFSAVFEHSIDNVPETSLPEYDVALQVLLDRFRRRRDGLIKDLQNAR